MKKKASPRICATASKWLLHLSGVSEDHLTHTHTHERTETCQELRASLTHTHTRRHTHEHTHTRTHTRTHTPTEQLLAAFNDSKSVQHACPPPVLWRVPPVNDGAPAQERHCERREAAVQSADKGEHSEQEEQVCYYTVITTLSWATAALTVPGLQTDQDLFSVIENLDLKEREGLPRRGRG